jgi:DNA mismatch repair ATPase MutS
MMRFSTDQQTLDDLNLIGRRGGQSVYALFNHTATRGGSQLLEELFRYPLSDADAINRRAALIRHLASTQMPFPFRSEWLDAAELYLDNTDERTRLAGDTRTLGGKLAGLIHADTDLQNIQKGVEALLAILRLLKDVIDGGGPFRAESEAVTRLLEEESLGPVWASPAGRLPYDRLAELDVLLRFRNREAIRRLLRQVYYLDVCITAGKAARERGYIFAKALKPAVSALSMEGVYHPLLSDAVPNTVEITANANVLFLTGANMAGKSTLMKTIGIALYLGHMGFPVPAQEMAFTVLDGIYTTINLPDNLGIGASHFYAEVLRVKKVAQELSRSGKLFVIFDELFRGTNVKDAYEATIAVTEAFAGKRNSIFLISTHIIEAGEVLRERCDNVRLVRMPTRMEGHTPVYTYTLEPGISADRHGMVIIRQEGILDILQTSAAKSRNKSAL